MIEREIVRLLQAEVARLGDDAWRLPRHLLNLGLSAEEAEKVRGVLIARQAKADAKTGEPAPFVFQSFAKLAGAIPPFIAVTLIDDRDTETFLGGVGGLIDNVEAELLGDVTLERTPKQASMFQSSYGVLCAAKDNVDVCIYLYEVAKAALMRGRPTFHAQAGTIDVQISGYDPTAQARYEPLNLYVRQLTVTVKRLYEIAPVEAETRFTSLRTISVQADGTGVDEADGRLWVRVAPTET